MTKKTFLFFLLLSLLLPLQSQETPQKHRLVLSLLTEPVGSPAASKETLFIALPGGKIFAIQPGKEKPLWEVSVEPRVSASPVLDKKGGLLVVSNNGILQRIDLRSGKSLWSYTLAEPVFVSPLIKGERVYLVGEKGTLHILDLKRGTPIEKHRVEGSALITSGIWRKDGNSFLLPDYDFKLLCIDLSGKTLWSFPTQGTNIAPPALTAQGEICLASMDHHLYKINPQGKLLWKFKTGGWLRSSPVIDSQGNVYFGSHDFTFYSLTPEGQLRWKYKGTAPFNASPLIDSRERIYAGDSSGLILAFSSKGEVLWSDKTADFVRTPFSLLDSQKVLAAGSIDGSILFYSIDSPLSTKAWWPRFLGGSSNQGRRE